VRHSLGGDAVEGKWLRGTVKRGRAVGGTYLVQLSRAASQYGGHRLGPLDSLGAERGAVCVCTLSHYRHRREMPRSQCGRGAVPRECTVTVALLRWGRFSSRKGGRAC